MKPVIGGQNLEIYLTHDSHHEILPTSTHLFADSLTARFVPSDPLKKDTSLTQPRRGVLHYRVAQLCMFMSELDAVSRQVRVVQFYLDFCEFV